MEDEVTDESSEVPQTATMPAATATEPTAAVGSAAATDDIDGTFLRLDSARIYQHGMLQLCTATLAFCVLQQLCGERRRIVAQQICADQFVFLQPKR